MNGRIPYFAVLALVLGIYMFVASYWLVWDWINSIVNGPWIDRKMFCEMWEFWAPVFVYRWTCETWTGPYDVHLLLAGLGALLIVASSFVLGYCYGARRALKARGLQR